MPSPHPLPTAIKAARGTLRADRTNPREPTPEPGKPTPIGSGQHGGWGPDETKPFLVVNDGRSSGTVGRATSLTDIAPTIAKYLGLPLEGFDGAPLH